MEGKQQIASIYMDTEEAASELGFSVGNVRKLCRTDEKFPSIRVGQIYYIHRELLEKWAREEAGGGVL